jgi:hypothetical protein
MNLFVICIVGGGAIGFMGGLAAIYYFWPENSGYSDVVDWQFRKAITAACTGVGVLAGLGVFVWVGELLMSR